MLVLKLAVRGWDCGEGERGGGLLARTAAQRSTLSTWTAIKPQLGTNVLLVTHHARALYVVELKDPPPPHPGVWRK